MYNEFVVFNKNQQLLLFPQTIITWYFKSIVGNNQPFVLDFAIIKFQEFSKKRAKLELIDIHVMLGIVNYSSYTYISKLLASVTNFRNINLYYFGTDTYHSISF